MRILHCSILLVAIFAFSANLTGAGANLLDGLISAWSFNGNLKDSVGNNDGEFFSAGAKPPPVDDKPKPDPGPTDLDDGIVSGWDFDGDLDDDIDNNDGEFFGAPAQNNPVYVDGKFGKAILFDGVDDYIEIPDDESLHLPEGLTVAAWINITSAADHAAICWKGEKIGWGANFSWRVAVTNDTSITWGRCVAGAEEYFATGGVLPGAGQWIHVALTCMSPDVDTTQRAYVNGEDITDATGQADNLNAQPPFLIFDGIPVEIGVGRARGGTVGNDMYFSGLIDELGIWDRGLTTDEINELMDGGLPSSRFSVDAHGKIATTWGRIKK